MVSKCIKLAAPIFFFFSVSLPPLADGIYCQRFRAGVEMSIELVGFVGARGVDGQRRTELYRRAWHSERCTEANIGLEITAWSNLKWKLVPLDGALRCHLEGIQKFVLGHGFQRLQMWFSYLEHSGKAFLDYIASFRLICCQTIIGTVPGGGLFPWSSLKAHCQVKLELTRSDMELKFLSLFGLYFRHSPPPPPPLLHSFWSLPICASTW